MIWMCSFFMDDICFLSISMFCFVSTNRLSFLFPIIFQVDSSHVSRSTYASISRSCTRLSPPVCTACKNSLVQPDGQISPFLNQNSHGILVCSHCFSLDMGTTPSISIYKLFQLFWRVKLFLCLTKIIGKITKLYSTKQIYILCNYI